MSGPCRVLVLNERDPLHPQAGGAEVHVAEIAKRLAPLGFESTQLACSFPGAVPVEELPGLTVRRLGPVPLYYPRAVAATSRARPRADPTFSPIICCAAASATGPLSPCRRREWACGGPAAVLVRLVQGVVDRRLEGRERLRAAEELDAGDLLRVAGVGSARAGTPGCR